MSAIVGTITTSSSCSVTTETSAVMPGFRRASGASMRMSTLKVTLPPPLAASEFATDAIAVTVPWLTISGNAGYVTLALCPTAILAMSFSPTCTVTFILDRSAICMHCLPPLVSLSPMIMPPVTVAPTLALSSTMLPELGAVTVRLAALAFAWSRFAWAEARLRCAADTAFVSADASETPAAAEAPSTSVVGVACATAAAFCALVRSSWAAATARCASATLRSSSSFLMVISTSPSLTDWPACTLMESIVPSTEGETTEDEMGLSWPFASTVVVNVPSVTMSVTGPLAPCGCALITRIATMAMSAMAPTTPAAIPRRISFLRRRSARFALSLAYASSSEISAVSFVRSLCLSACSFVIRGIVSVAPSGVRSVSSGPEVIVGTFGIASPL